MKNWSAARSITGQTYEQFKQYVTSGHAFDYYFSDAARGGMKNSFQNLFKNADKVDELWEANRNFFQTKGFSTKSRLKKAAQNGELLESPLLDFVK